MENLNGAYSSTHSATFAVDERPKPGVCAMAPQSDSNNLVNSSASKIMTSTGFALSQRTAAGSCETTELSNNANILEKASSEDIDYLVDLSLWMEMIYLAMKTYIRNQLGLKTLPYGHYADFAPSQSETAQVLRTNYKFLPFCLCLRNWAVRSQNKLG